MAERVRLNVVITGRVQGVGYRFSALAKARELRLTGWVRNMPDGQGVEAAAEGAQDDVLAFLAWCHQGPALARVTDVAHSISDPVGAFKTFDVRF